MHRKKKEIQELSSCELPCKLSPDWIIIKSIKIKHEKGEDNKKNKTKQKQRAPHLVGMNKKAQKENINLCQDHLDDAVSFFFQYPGVVKVQMNHSAVT